ncbi:TrmB family transcriptional regulator [Candidatus Saccharibacteria bacterium]|nr:TrmB family transcriptional regulator [Candidatus Saccharibacteria bacterium]
MSELTKNLQILLAKIGLNEVEALVYASLLELDSVSIRKVAEHAGINRGTTYDAIKHLVQLGLVSGRRSGSRDYYSAEGPDKIYDLIRDKRKDLIHAQREVDELLPKLTAQSPQAQGRPLVKYYEDDHGIVTILRDVLQTCGQLREPLYYVYSSLPLRQYLYRKFPEFTERRVEEGIAVKVIAIGEGGDPAAIAERKWLEPGKHDSSSYTIIYGNKVAMISIANNLTPYGVIIEDEGNATMQRHLFDQLWSRL